MKNKKGIILMLGGSLLLAAAMCLTLYNIWDESRAGSAAKSVLTQLTEAVPNTEKRTSDSDFQFSDTENLPDYILNPSIEMPTIQIDENAYIGFIEIPALNLSLPVMSEWSYPLLRISPCRYKGSAYLDNLIVAGHNYSTHFGSLSSLEPGSDVRFTDADGNVFKYNVSGIEVLNKTDTKEMEAGDWDLTLFTCTISGETRVTVRCKRNDKN